MKIGIIGLGLIGGSFAKAWKQAGYTVMVKDIDANIEQFAVLSHAADGILNDAEISVCDCILLAQYPAGVSAFLEESSSKIKKGSLVLDCTGVKRSICKLGFEAAAKHDFHFIGGHPMAGLQFSGFTYAYAALFQNTCMILVPKPDEDVFVLKRISDLMHDAGFSSITVTTAEEHDKRIAFTSQLAHVVSNAYVKSPNAACHKGFSAGSYRDLTRVAYLNETMWSELFLENRDHLGDEIDALIQSLEKYREALRNNDGERLKDLLKEGRLCKERIDFQ